ncbi:glycosyltransferase family 39 protein [Candidatus Curtissbacteria bacterium]|nr:glycosyltransferase family 39 protein [Candidatus Curtissbacteria bacterium]
MKLVLGIPKSKVLLFLAFFAIAAAIRVYLIFLRKYPAGDEIWAYYLIKGSYGEIWLSTLSDLHGPFYFLLLKTIGTVLGVEVGVILMRFVSLFFGFWSIFSIWYLAHLLIAKKGSGVVVFLGLFLPSLIWVSIFARYYSFLNLLSSLVLIFFLKMHKKRNFLAWIAFTLVSIVGIYTHYYFPLILVSLLIFLIFFNRFLLKRFMISLALIFVAILPLAYNFLSLPKPEIAGRHINDLVKIPATILTNLSSFEVLLFIYKNGDLVFGVLFMAIFALIYIYLLYFALRSLKRSVAGFLMFNMLAPPIIIIFFAYIFYPLLALSSLVIFLPAQILLLSVGIFEAIKKNKYIFFGFSAFVLSSFILLVKSSYSYSLPQNDIKPVLLEFKEGDLILHTHIYSYIMGRYYFRDSANYGISKAYSANANSEKALGYKMLDRDQLLGSKRIWFFYPPWDVRPEIVEVKTMLDKNFEVSVKNIIASKIRFQENDFQVYLYEKLIK